MVLNLKRIFSGLQSKLAFAYELDMSRVDMDGQHPFYAPVSLRGDVVNQSGIISLRYEAQFVYCTQCFRCAEECKEDCLFSFHHLLATELSGDDEEGYLLVEDELLDLDEVAMIDILLELPTKFLCKPDCEGLCPSCGKNLNEGMCTCKQGNVDPRLESLRQLLD